MFFVNLPLAFALIVVALLVLGGCAAPSLSTWGEHYQWHYLEIKSAPLSLKALISKQAQTHSSNMLHIYLEGDGEPFLNSLTVSPDPTPHDPLMLHLMAKDTDNSVFLARPCYFEQANTCSPHLWTLARYSPLVVQSLANAIEILAQPYDSVVLIGHSGGGTLAALLSSRVPKVTHLITLSGNLDIDRWTTHHALTPLSASLNPMTQAPLPERVRQIHYVGMRDKNILPQWAEAFARQQPHAQVIVLKDFDHHCCWETHWPDLLSNALAVGATITTPRLVSPP